MDSFARSIPFRLARATGFAALFAGCGADSPSHAGGTAGSGNWGIEARPTGQTCQPPATTSAQPALLSESGCADPSDPTRPAATLLPYGVASPLWSDHADKQRFIALSDGATIHVQDDGDWDFPAGTVFVKTFALGGKLIETRLLMRKGEFDWWGFSYRWRDDQSDADLLASNTDGYDATYEGPDGPQNWHFPSRQQCLQCHTTAAGVSLGLETSQLNFEYEYPNGVVGNQLDTLAHVGLFDSTPETRPAYPSPADETLSAEERARSYLHANCSFCHRPGSNYTGIDLRFSSALEDMHVCGEAPDKGDLGVSGALRVAPGEPENSVLSLRMRVLDPLTRMPQIGSRVVDPVGTSSVDAWITSVADCP